MITKTISLWTLAVALRGVRRAVKLGWLLQEAAARLEESVDVVSQRRGYTHAELTEATWGPLGRT